LSPNALTIGRMSNSLPGTSTRCRIELEDWAADAAAAIRSDSRPDALRHGLRELAELLARLVDDPDNVSLIIPNDLRESIQRRQPDEPYTVERGSGLVAGRTMQQPNGHIDVIINAYPIAKIGPRGTPVLDRTLMSMVSRTVTHEAQHAVMRQRNSGFDEYRVDEINGVFNRPLATSAAQLCDEHRAEWRAIQLTEPNPPTADDVRAVLAALGAELTAANAIYQQAPDTPQAVFALATAVFAACGPFWVSLGYWAAQFRGDDGTLDGIPEEITELPLWQRYSGDVWAHLQRSLTTLPVEDLSTSANVLRSAAAAVAAALTVSLETIGFRCVDAGDNSAFYITRWDFPT
jgi:hypothetical protein